MPRKASRQTTIMQMKSPHYPSVQQDIIALLPRLRRFALGLCGQRDEADDLVQTACERALRSLDQFQAGTRLDSWLYRIIQNLHKDARRRYHHRGDPVDPHNLPEPQGGDHRREMESQQTLAVTLAALEQLSEDQRAALLLTSVEGLSYEEAAQTLAIPMGTLMSRISRGRQRLYQLVFGKDADTFRSIAGV